ncbi:hypothetical protein IKF94_00070 [Candidatus Saccharibacteria bacterium]|nr:hypothetical protein [Candidatus Saccharibacteria bacterium]
MKKFFVATVSAVMVFTLPVSTYALSAKRLDEFAQNNILFYDPDSVGGGDTVCTESNSGANVNYAGEQVWTDAEMQTIEANRAIYEEAASQYNFPWQVLAVVHSLETSLQRWNYPNGQGVYMLYSYTRAPDGSLDPDKAFLPEGEISEEEFRRQTLIAAEIISGMVGDLNDTKNVKKLFYSYNGSGGVYYHDKAIALGFGEEGAAIGEGSPYVMNRYDAKRDPDSQDVDPTWKGIWQEDPNKDGGSWYNPDAYSTVFGAYVKYEALGGGSGSLNCISSSGGLVSGGFKTAAEADAAIMEYYRTKRDEYAYMETNQEFVEVDGAHLKAICAGGPLNNCVAFTQWFIAKYTTAGNIGLPDGKDVVRTLAAGPYGFGSVQNEPRPYAVFSRQSDSTGGTSKWGHTGIVLGVDEEKDKIIIGESGCGANLDWTGAHEYSLSDYRTSDFSYVYTDEILVGL